ncbi:MAG: hypothetical protein GWP08_21280 [Nitrospiraceae bacterium]|nr:hypothetical protein [Nitrospiraceae bacterium]
MRYEVKLTDMGDDTFKSGIVSMWLADLGAELDEDDDLLEMTTDKAAFTIPCPKDGILLEHCVQPDQAIQVGDVIAILDVQESNS